MEDKQRQAALLRKIFATTVKSITDNRNDKVMCVVFASGDKEIVRCSPQDDYDPEIGFALAYLRHILGSRTQVLRFLKEHSRVITSEWHATNPSLERPVEFDPHWFRDWMEERKLSSAGTFNKLCFGLGLNKEERGSLLRCLTKRRPRCGE